METSDAFLPASEWVHKMPSRHSIRQLCGTESVCVPVCAAFRAAQLVPSVEIIKDISSEIPTFLSLRGSVCVCAHFHCESATAGEVGIEH